MATAQADSCWQVRCGVLGCRGCLSCHLVSAKALLMAPTELVWLLQVQDAQLGPLGLEQAAAGDCWVRVYSAGLVSRYSISSTA